MRKRILMIEDGKGLAMAVRDRLLSVGYDFEWAADGPSGLEKAKGGSWDLILIDVMLPLLTGDQIVKKLREEGLATPLILVTAKDQTADDYITKPFHFDEFLARIEAHLRRGPAFVETEGGEHVWLNTLKSDVPFGEFTLRFKTGQLLKHGVAVALSHQELRLLCLFVSHPREVMGTERLLREAWDYQAVVTSRTVYVHVAWLRKKLRSEERPDGHITTVRGIGYVFEP